MFGTSMFNVNIFHTEQNFETEKYIWRRDAEVYALFLYMHMFVL